MVFLQLWFFGFIIANLIQMFNPREDRYFSDGEFAMMVCRTLVRSSLWPFWVAKIFVWIVRQLIRGLKFFFKNAADIFGQVITEIKTKW